MEERRVCTGCGSSYHLMTRPPRIKGVCDRCGRILTRRTDDAPDTVRRRLQLYHQEARAVEDFYRERELLRAVPPGDTPEEVESAIRTILSAPPFAVVSA